MKLAVIPARGGSKRIPRKNIKDFCGKPMIAWSIEAAAKSGCFDRIIVSTDDEEIADVSRQSGAEIPFMRPSYLADDVTGTIPVVKHAIEASTNGEFDPEFVCCIYATAPFLRPEDILLGFEMLKGSAANYAFSVTSYAFPIQRALRINDGRVSMFDPLMFEVRSQDLEDSFHDAGQFYWGRAEAWRNERVVFHNHSLPIILPRHRVQDIDVEEDWVRAELMFRAMKSMAGSL